MSIDNQLDNTKKTKNYAGHWSNIRFQKIFLGFKKIILKAELDFAQQCAKIISSYLPHAPISIVDVGAGDGLVSLGFLREIKKYRNIRRYSGFDISPGLVDLLRSKEKKFLSYADTISFISADAHNFILPQHADLIVAFNSWYGISWKEIPRFMGILGNNGVLAILLNSKNSITLDLTRHFVEPIVSSEDLILWLKKKKIRHRVYDLHTNSMSKRNFLRGSVLNKKAEFFFRYLLRRTVGPLADIGNYLLRKEPAYFHIPQQLVLISR